LAKSLAIASARTKISNAFDATPHQRRNSGRGAPAAFYLVEIAGDRMGDPLRQNRLAAVECGRVPAGMSGGVE
jgi:hypothetical protein